MNKRIVAVLKKLEVALGAENIFWNISAETGKFLNILVRNSRADLVLEVGTSNGYSGLWFAEALSHTGGKLYTVESHRERFDLAHTHFLEAGVNEDSVVQIFGHAPEVFSPEVAAELPWPKPFLFDVIFLDATKIEYESYLKSVMPLLKKGGLLIADNVISHADELQDFLASVKQNTELASVIVPIGSGLLIAFKN